MKIGLPCCKMSSFRDFKRGFDAILTTIPQDNIRGRPSILISEKNGFPQTGFLNLDKLFREKIIPQSHQAAVFKYTDIKKLFHVLRFYYRFDLAFH